MGVRLLLSPSVRGYGGEAVYFIGEAVDFIGETVDYVGEASSTLSVSYVYRGKFLRPTKP